uniref:Iron-sulfur cluster loop n=1 Tax=Desulfobacca acetoxidans TaxID=60893 RepID=A0A7V4G6P3_9BACT
MNDAIKVLIKKGQEIVNQPYKKVYFTGQKEADSLLNDLKKFPHAFVLACVMDRQIKAERAWMIPFEISDEIGGFDFQKLFALPLKKIKRVFQKRALHRFNETMAENFYLAIKKIHETYNSDASNIWKDNPKSATVVRRFLQFKGVGVKIASMAANILARDFKIQFADKICIDISPDVQVNRVFIRLGLIDKNATRDELIYCARELHPEYPGVLDLPAWEIGREFCRPNNPVCEDCYLEKYCPKVDID